MTNIKKKEEILLRSGNILNGLGVFRAAHIYGNEMTREQFNELVKKNWFLTELDESFHRRIDEAWKGAIEFIDGLKVNDGSNDEIIKYKELRDFLVFEKEE